MCIFSANSTLPNSHFEGWGRARGISLLYSVDPAISARPSLSCEEPLSPAPPSVRPELTFPGTSCVDPSKCQQSFTATSTGPRRTAQSKVDAVRTSGTTGFGGGSKHHTRISLIAACDTRLETVALCRRGWFSGGLFALGGGGALGTVKWMDPFGGP